MSALSVAEAAEQLGISTAAVRQRLYTGSLKGRKTQKGWHVYLNGDELEKPPSPEINDPLEIIADQLILLGKELKKSIKYHDAQVRQQAISEFATTLAETVQKGVK